MTPALELWNLLEDLERKGTNVIDLVTDGQPLRPWRLYPGDADDAVRAIPRGSRGEKTA